MEGIRGKGSTRSGVVSCGWDYGEQKRGQSRLSLTEADKVAEGTPKDLVT